MPQFVIVLAAALAMLFNILGVPNAAGAAAASGRQPSTPDVMMVVDQVLRRV